MNTKDRNNDQSFFLSLSKHSAFCLALGSVDCLLTTHNSRRYLETTNQIIRRLIACGLPQGARIGRDAYIDSVDMSDFDLINIGDDVAINEGATLLGHYLKDGLLHFGEVRCVTCTLQANQALNALSLLQRDLMSRCVVWDVTTVAETRRQFGKQSSHHLAI
jgi:hypothetical protein